MSCPVLRKWQSTGITHELTQLLLSVGPRCVAMRSGTLRFEWGAVPLEALPSAHLSVEAKALLSARLPVVPAVPFTTSMNGIPGVSSPDFDKKVL